MIAERVHNDVPILAWAKIEARIVWTDKVRGVTPNHSGVAFFYQAWMDA